MERGEVGGGGGGTGGISVDAVVRQLGANCAVRPSLAATISGKFTPSLRKAKEKHISPPHASCVYAVWSLCFLFQTVLLKGIWNLCLCVK